MNNEHRINELLESENRSHEQARQARRERDQARRERDQARSMADSVSASLLTLREALEHYAATNRAFHVVAEYALRAVFGEQRQPIDGKLPAPVADYDLKPLGEYAPTKARLLDLKADARFTLDRVGAPGSLVRTRAEVVLFLLDFYETSVEDPSDPSYPSIAADKTGPQR
jgi:hypothetical protein